jgi:aryl sulfotransferase
MANPSEDNEVKWPSKQTELQHQYFDSALWNDFPFRDDDIVVGTYAKSGTTWVQQIISQLIFNGAEDVDVPEISPWVDMRLPPSDQKFPALETQTHRRFMKTHLQVDALVYSPKAKYLFVARDGRDVVWSFYNHHANMNDIFYKAINDEIPHGMAPAIPPEDEIYEYFHRWLDNDGYPLWSFWDNIKSWWDIQHLPNFKLVHFNSLKADLAGEIREIAQFLDIAIDEKQWDAIVEHCGFDYMHANAEKSVPMGGVIWKGGAKTFINKGTNGRWRDVLTAEDNHKYESLAVENLGPECAHWLATGELPD